MNRQEKTRAQALLSGSKMDIQTEKGNKANNNHSDDNKNSSSNCPVTHHVSGMCLLLSSTVSCNRRAISEDKSSSPFYKRGNQSSERFSDLLKGTQLVSG